MSRTAMMASPAMATTFNLLYFSLGVTVLAYFSTFVLFAVVRILTGVSIQRVGYLSLKRISLELRQGIKLEIRKLGLNLHRPTFSQPTWVSLVIQDSQLTIDPWDREEDSDEAGDKAGGPPDTAKQSAKGDTKHDQSKGVQFIDTIRKAKESVKKLHRWIEWIRWVDVVFSNTTVVVSGVGNVQVGSFTVLVDTRKKTAERSRMFDHCTDVQGLQSPVEWLIGAKSVLLFTLDNKEPLELLDHSVLTVYGVHEKGREGITDIAVALNVGRISLPCDELLEYMAKIKSLKQSEERKVRLSSKSSKVSLSSVMEQMALPGSRTERMAEAVMESKELLNSILKGVKEIQTAIGYLVISKSLPGLRPAGQPLQVMVGMKEIGMNIHRLDQKSPAHRMYFSSKDIAHQALLAAISISMSISDGVHQDKVLYIPMVTMTSRSTLLSKTIQIVEKLESDRNSNILFANMVVTSPSIDLEPRHLPLLVAFMRSRSGRPTAPSAKRAHLISRLLPKASIKFSVQEPVIRIVLPPTEPEYKGTEDMDMLISSLSSISVDLEASHEADGQTHYSLSSTFRLTSHILYYRAASGVHHELLHTETFDLKTQLNATPEVQVMANAYMSAFSLRLVRPEIVEGLKEMVSQFRRDYKPDKLRRPITPSSPNMVRRLPLWLETFKLECNDFSIEVAGVDAKVSETTRGAAVQVESWTIDYRCRKGDLPHRPLPRRRAQSRTLNVEEARSAQAQGPSSPYSTDPTDGRRLALHLRDLGGFIVESSEPCDQEPFLRVPLFDLILATGTDVEGSVLDVSTSIKSIFFNYSLYRHYSVLVAAKVLQESFGGKAKDGMYNAPTSSENLEPELYGNMALFASPTSKPEFTNVTIKVQHIRVKAELPSDPPMMVDVHGVDAGRFRWGFPYVKTKNFRLYAGSPKLRKCWVRLISWRHFRIDLRRNKRQSHGVLIDDSSIDLNADAIRLAIPHQLVLYKVTDNLINTFKACQQIHHRFKTGTDEYILEKVPEGPRLIPKLSLRTKALLFELEDDPFETQLGLIYRIGLSEQKKRLAREAAFEAKVKKMEDKARRKSWETTRTGTDNSKIGLRGRSRTWKSDAHAHVNPSVETRSKPRSRSAHEPGWNMRYDPDAAAEPSEDASISPEEAWERLQEHNSTAWIRRIRQAKEQHRNKVAEAREAFWGHDDMPSEPNDPEGILALPLRPALMASYFSDVSIIVDKPSFPLEQLPKFLHRVGKGLPEETLYSLLIPLSIRLDFGEARVLLRDYPLPFIHVPPLRIGQPSKPQSWTLKADFVLAEEYRGHESMRLAKVKVVPQTQQSGGLAIDVRRTVSPVKSYSDVKVSINTSHATRITWCTSYQPAIQDMMMVFETFTKPHVDPSERTGFWDKIRLILHSQITLAWKGDGDVHLILKGSRDPYKVISDGAGFVMCWRGDVCWDLARDTDPQKFIKVDSEEYLLAIPDFTRQAGEETDLGMVQESRSFLSSNSTKGEALFKKVIMKLGGRVSWLVGLLFEQEITFQEDWKQRKRSFDFKPHYEVTLKSPDYAVAPPGEVYDAFRGFRSHHLHLSLSIVSPDDRAWSSPNTGSLSSYNSIHLTPRFFTHFFAWWGLFSGAMSLPIRQGALWPGPEKSNKKFGRHLATIKYKLCLSPLFISHVYKHHDKDEAGNDVIAATGLKAKLDTFLLDVHMRREENVTNAKSTTMKINQAELDFHSADIRAVSAVIDKAAARDMINQTSGSPDDTFDVSGYQNDMSQFTIADGDYTWIDMDDFVELDWLLPKNRTPIIRVMPLAFTPRFTYFRQTDHSVDEDGAHSAMSCFGNEGTHDCIMSQSNDPREIQCALVQARLERVNQQMSRNKEAIELLAQHTKLNPDDTDLKRESERLIRHSSVLFNKLNFLQDMLRKISSKLEDGGGIDHSRHTSSADSELASELLEMDASAFTDYASDFDNRFIVHNMQAKWNNSLRNIILKYIHQVGQRRGFIYYMSRRAVKFIEDILQEQRAASGQKPQSNCADAKEPKARNASDQSSDDVSIEARIQELLNDKTKYAVADEKTYRATNLDEVATKMARTDLAGDVADEYIPQNSYHVRLIAPQIQMQSEKNEGSAVLVVAQGMQLKVVSIMDRNRIGDEVSGLVQRRFALNLDNTQFFVSRHVDFAQESMSLHSANSYGAPNGSIWPPWVPLESMFDFQNNPLGFSRVVERTSATLRYDKHNSLRLKYSDKVSDIETGQATAKNGPLDSERRIDYVWVDFPRVEALCDSSQYFAMYIIVLDLLLYAEPLEKLRNEKLEKIMLASDFSDLTGAPEMVECLQSRIQQLTEIKQHFDVNARSLDAGGWRSRMMIDEDLDVCEEELFFMMKAITTAQRKYEDRGARSSGVVRWYLTASEIIWHLMRGKADPLMDIALKKAAYERVDNADGSNYNTVEVESMKGFNLLPDAVYPDMIAPFLDSSRTMADVRQTKMLRVYWHQLEAIAGIPIMDHFEVNLFPMKIQLEREIGKRIFEYIFPDVSTNALESNGGFSPFIVHAMKPVPDELKTPGPETVEATIHVTEPTQDVDDSSSTKSEYSGGVELRLRPTLSLSADHPRPRSAHSEKRPKTSSATSLFGKPKKSATNQSSDSLPAKTRKSLDGPAPSVFVSERGKKIQLFSRSSSSTPSGPSDELSQMMTRASNYMTLSYIKIPSVVLCLSYKGRSDSNLRDIHEFIFKMPMLEYRNKTWSNLDLAIHLKRDIIRALISHTGAIIQNKFTNHRPNKQEPNHLRLMANSGSSLEGFYQDSTLDSPGNSLEVSRPMTSGTLMPRQGSPATSIKSNHLSVSSSSHGTSYSESTLSRDDSDIADRGGIFHNTLGKHLASMASIARQRDETTEDTEESIKKKSRLLLGKKVFGGL